MIGSALRLIGRALIVIAAITAIPTLRDKLSKRLRTENIIPRAKRRVRRVSRTKS